MKSVISDMDGVIYYGESLIPGAKEFVETLLAKNVSFLFLTNNASQTPLDLKRKLERMGIHGVTEDHFITASMATAAFLASQKPNGSAYVVGGGGLTAELYNAGYSITEKNPDYVVVGLTKHFNYEMLNKACELILSGAKFIGTNPDVADRAKDGGLTPATGSVLAAIETATGKKPYILGKPNPLMMTYGRKKLNARSSDTAMIGDRMDTDIIGGLEAGMRTCLVLSGVTTLETLRDFPYQPDLIYDSVADIDLSAL